MKLRGLKHFQLNPTVFLFKITSRCNDFCKFCIEYEFIKAKRPDLSLTEIKNNYSYLRKKFEPDYVILTGGEPTLHPEFFEILDFFKREGVAIRLITNLLNFNRKNFLKRLKPFFSRFKNKKQEQLSRVIVSINDLPGRHPSAFKRIQGLRNALKCNLPLMITVLIYQDNVRDLPAVASLLTETFKKFAPSRILYVEFRFIYIEGTPKNLLEDSVPKNFYDIISSVEKAIDILESFGAKITLWNFPVCYLDKPERIKNAGIGSKLERRFIKINKDLQLQNVAVRDWGKYLKPYKKCRVCKFNNICSGVDKDYFKKFGFPSIRPR